MSSPGRCQPMPVKHWTRAGLLLTGWCSARCASCYVCGGAGGGAPADMTVERGLALWEGLVRAGPHGCRVHIGGGEPFGRWEVLLELCRAARGQGLGPLEAVETNAYWADDAAVVRQRVAALSEAGMERLALSADPFHQQFVPLERVRLAARVAQEVLGAGRVRVRWREWLDAGFDTAELPEARRREVFAAWLARGHERITGRAAVELAGLLPTKPAAGFVDNPCRQVLLRGKGVHVDGEGTLSPATCWGLVVGRCRQGGEVFEAWAALAEEAQGPGPLGVLARSGPAGLLDGAVAQGYRPLEGYAGKCHLCWHVRRWMFEQGLERRYLGPAAAYRP